jgi:hypothetical protein
MRFVAVSLWLGICSIAPGAVADDGEEPSLADKETARSLFEEGDRKYRAGDYDGALAAFEAADEIMRVPTTGLERGRTLAQLGRLLEAREILLRVTRYPVEEGENEVFARARDEARELAADVGARIPSLQVQIDGLAPGAEVELRVDGAVVPPKAARFPRKVDPGAHLVEVEAEGFDDAKRTIVVRERDSAQLRIAMAREGSASAPVDDGASEGPLGLSIMSWVGFSVGAAGLVLGAVAGGITLANVSELDERCPSGRDECPESLQDDIDQAQAISHASTAGFVIAGVGAAVGVAGLFLFGPLSFDESGLVRPWVGIGSAGVTGRF